jgi:hypothetical protein
MHEDGVALEVPGAYFTAQGGSPRRDVDYSVEDENMAAMITWYRFQNSKGIYSQTKDR